jgi:hypothetical protein
LSEGATKLHLIFPSHLAQDATSANALKATSYSLRGKMPK